MHLTNEVKSYSVKGSKSGTKVHNTQTETKTKIKNISVKKKFTYLFSILMFKMKHNAKVNSSDVYELQTTL